MPEVVVLYSELKYLEKLLSESCRKNVKYFNRIKQKVDKGDTSKEKEYERARKLWEDKRVIVLKLRNVLKEAAGTDSKIDSEVCIELQNDEVLRLSKLLVDVEEKIKSSIHHYDTTKSAEENASIAEYLTLKDALKRRSSLNRKLRGVLVTTKANSGRQTGLSSRTRQGIGPGRRSYSGPGSKPGAGPGV